MLASLGTDLPAGEGWTFEPKYDGIRVLAFATPGSAALVTRNGKSKTAQFPEIVAALRSLAARRRRPLVLDGEIVSVRDGDPLRFQELQARMHVQDAASIARHAEDAPAALFTFDFLVDGDDVLLAEPWIQRRARLERVMRGVSGALVLTGTMAGSGSELLEQARAMGWEGIIAKRVQARYQPGVRSRDWLKLKIEQRQEFVVGGFTEPRGSRAHIGALLLGYYDDAGRLVYAGHTGGGFTREGLAAMYRTLRPLIQPACPFVGRPRTNERAHWVRPEVVVEVKFNEWTTEGKLRQPIFLGIRDDKEAREVGRERQSLQRTSGRAARKRAARKGATKRSAGQSAAKRVAGKSAAKRKPKQRKPKPRPAKKRVTTSRTAKQRVSKKKPVATKGAAETRDGRRRGASARDGDAQRMLAQLDRIEQEGGDGELHFDDGRSLAVTSLGKIYFPGPRLTKGDAMRHYARVSPWLLPLIADRPLALKRFPEGVEGPSFYQQNAGDAVPAGVRVETLDGDARRFVGGDLLTLLYTVQIGSVDVHPWLSRVGALDHPDHIVLDLDPGRDTPFATVVAVAGLVRQALASAGLRGALKTSGSRGLHVFLPLSPGTSYADGAALAERLARQVADREPESATVERRIAARPKGSVYVDHQQNARGKTVASAYAVRARPEATVSFPLPWSALRPALDPARFTITAIARRLAASRRVWHAVLEAGNPASALRELR